MSIEHDSDLPDPRPSLDAELEQPLLDAIVYLWHSSNYDYFGGKLRPPTITLMDSPRRLGEWDPETRTISINRRMALEYPWRFTEQTLQHELAHQYVSEHARVQEAPHGPEFRRACLRMGISPSASTDLDPHAPSHCPRPQDGTMRIVTKVKRLLALADSPNRNEAENAAAMARRLMVKYNVERAEASNEDGEPYGYLHLGAPTRRIQAHQRLIAGILGQYFFVQAVLTQVFDPEKGCYARVIEIAGQQHNLEMARYVHDFLLETADRLWERHYEQAQLRSRRPRLTFLAGVMSGFASRLSNQDRELSTEGLIAVEDAKLSDFVSLRHPRLHSARPSHRRRTADYNAGRQAGQEIVLNQPVSSTQTRRKPRALGPG